MNRRSVLFFAILLTLTSATVARAQITGNWDGYVTLSVSSTTFTTATSIVFYPSLSCAEISGDCYWRLEGEHSLDAGGIGFNQSIYVVGLSYHGSFQAPADPGVCATASSYGMAWLVNYGSAYPVGYSGPFSSDQKCAPVRQCTLTISAGYGGTLTPNPTGIYNCGSTMQFTAVPQAGYHFVSWSGDITSSSATITFVLNGDMTMYANFDADQDPDPPPPDDGCSAEWPSSCSPVVINFAKDDYRLTGTQSPVLFDIAATGKPVWIGWTAAGADEAFLCLDRDHDGKITSGAELFGNATPLGSGGVARNGFLALAEYDDNHDGVIDASDSIWPQLQLWCDLNHDGISQASELSSVVGSGLAAISLDYHWTGRRDPSENLFKYESKVRMMNPGGQASPRPVYDIFFVRLP